MWKIRKTYKYRLYPTKNQIVILDKQLALCCELYNAALQERRDAWKMARKSIDFRSQSDQLPQIKADRLDVNGVYSQVLQDVLHRVDKTFQSFFRRVRRKETPGFPRFRSRAWYDSFTYPQLGFAIKDARLNLSKIGSIKIKLHRPVDGKIKTLTIKRAAGKWYACFSVEMENVPFSPSSKSIGIDIGLTHFATLSDGREIDNPRFFRTAEAALRIAQRKIARRKRDSRRRRKAIRLLQRTHVHIGCQRSNFHHQVSRALVNAYGFIAVEDLNVKGLTKGMLAKSVSDAGWSSFIAKLAYKAENAGRMLIKVDPRGTSQTCICGASVPKTLGQRWHKCLDCGLSLGRDHVAAKNILGLGLSLQESRAMAPFLEKPSALAVGS